MAETPTFEAGTTIRVRATFREWREEGDTTPADVVDPTSVTVTLFDVNRLQLAQYVTPNPVIVKVTVAPADYPTRPVPYYYYDWTLPDPGTYLIEFEGLIQANPILVRQKIKTKWDVK